MTGLMNGMKYRLAVFEDQKEIQEKTIKDRDKGLISSIPIYNKLIFKEAIKNKQYIIAQHEKYGIVGFVSFNKRKDGVIRINNLWVQEEYRRNGIGSKLIKYVGSPLELTVVKTNKDAILFYFKKGFYIFKDEGRMVILRK